MFHPSTRGRCLHHLLSLGIAALGALALSSVLAATEPDPAAHSGAAGWPRWRGATGMGHAANLQPPPQWSGGSWPARWEAEVGEGWSSPVMADGRVFVTDRVAGEERTLAFDAESGKPLWTKSHPVDFDPHAVGRRHGNGPKSTPLVARDKVYSLGIAGFLECFRVADGESVWKLNLPAALGNPVPLEGGRARVVREEHVLVPIGGGMGAAVPLFGYTGSLTADDSRLIVPAGQPRGGAIMALDLDTGERVWQALDEHLSYSSPVIADVAGRRQVVVMTGPRVVGLDLESGKLLWSHPFQIQYDESISTPVVSGNTVFVTGDGRPLTALRITRGDEECHCEVAWECDELSSYLSSMIAVDGHIYGMGNHGEFHCVRIADGEVVWSGGEHGFYCTPAAVGRDLLCLNEEGDLLVIAADPQSYHPLANAVLASGGTWTSPAVTARRLFVRSGSHLMCFAW